MHAKLKPYRASSFLCLLLRCLKHLSTVKRMWNALLLYLFSFSLISSSPLLLPPRPLFYSPLRLLKHRNTAERVWNALLLLPPLLFSSSPLVLWASSFHLLSSSHPSASHRATPQHHSCMQIYLIKSHMETLNGV